MSGGGTLQSTMRGGGRRGFRPKVHPFTLLYTIVKEKVALSYAFHILSKLACFINKSSKKEVFLSVLYNA